MYITLDKGIGEKRFAGMTLTNGQFACICLSVTYVILLSQRACNSPENDDEARVATEERPNSAGSNDDLTKPSIRVAG